MATSIKIGGKGRLFVGEDKTIRGHVKDDAGGSVDVTGWGIQFVVRATGDDAADPPLITKTATISGAFAVTNNPQRVIVALTDTDLAIAKGKYRYSFKRTDDGSETILGREDFIVERATQI